MVTRITETCLIDMDGVLCDFIGHVLGKYGYTMKDLINAHGLENMPYPYDLDELFKPFGLKSEEIFESLTIDDWVAMPKLPWANDLVKVLRNHFNDYVQLGIGLHICTALPNGSPKAVANAIIGKSRWVRKNFKRLSNRLLFSREKNIFASKRTLLIDDCEYNKDMFIKSGGIAVLFPAVWNSAYHHYNDPLEYVIPRIMNVA